MYEIVIRRAGGILSLAPFMLGSLLTSAGCCTAGIESNMENAITAAPQVRKIKTPKVEEEKGGGLLPCK